jgi:hypothetical protein
MIIHMNTSRPNPVPGPLVVLPSKGAATVDGKVVNTKHVAYREDALPGGEMRLRDGVVYIGRFQHWGLGRYYKASPFANPYTVRQYGLDESLRLFEERMRSRPDLLGSSQGWMARRWRVGAPGKTASPRCSRPSNPTLSRSGLAEVDTGDKRGVFT